MGELSERGLGVLSREELVAGARRAGAQRRKLVLAADEGGRVAVA
jgi:hypothetical protein